MHDVAEIGIERSAAFPLWKSPTAVGQFVPYGRRDRALWPVRVQTLENCRIGCLRDGRGDDAGVEKICELQSVTLRPVVLSRAPAAKWLSTPISSSECGLEECLVRVAEMHTRSSESLEFPARDKDRNWLPAAGQFDLDTGFGLIDNLGKSGSRFCDRISSRHALSVHPDVHERNRQLMKTKVTGTGPVRCHEHLGGMLKFYREAA